MATSARLEELLQKFGENPRRYFAPLANEHRKLGELDQAIALCRTHLPQQPQHVSGHIVLAQALFEAGHTPDARETFELALDLDPENLIALRYLGDIARTQGDFPTARHWYERVLDADPRNDEISRLVRELENGAAAATPQAPEPAAEAAPSAIESLSVSESVPNEEGAPAVDAHVSEEIEDLAAAWQHEVSALDRESAFATGTTASEPEAPVAETGEPLSLKIPAPSGEAQPDEFVAEQVPVNIESLALSAEVQAVEFVAEQEPVSIGSLAPSVDAAPEPVSLPEYEPEAAGAFEAGLELTASRMESDEPFVETPPVEAELVPPAPVFAEIDYSMFEAVADEEVSAVTPPAPSAEAAVEEAPVEEAPAATGDDWFAMPGGKEVDVHSVEVSSEATFDLDAAFQSVLPNNSAEEVFESPGALADFGDLPPATESEWVPEAIGEASVDASEPMALETTAEVPQFETTDSVDDAFAQLDSMSASLEIEISGSAMLLPDEEYVEQEGVEVAAEAAPSIARTPEMGVPAVESAPPAFVTETMAELYLQQGFREEALAVYRQLLLMNPDDAVLAERVRSLEGGAQESELLAESPTGEELHVPIQPHADSAGQSMRAFLGVFARRRAPMRRRESARPEASPQPESGLSALFGSTNGGDDGVAAVLAGAFAQPNAEQESLPGRPTRAAAAELSLGDVFGGGAGAATSTSRSATFDEFFSAGTADRAPQSPLDEEGSDMEQFTAWLEGLKKK